MHSPKLLYFFCFIRLLIHGLVIATALPFSYINIPTAQIHATSPLFKMDIKSSTKDQDLATVPSHISAYDEETGRIERSGRRIGRSMMILRVIIRILDFLTSLVSKVVFANNRIASAAMTAGCLQQYFSTLNLSNLGQMLWNPNSMIWPTVTGLAVSLLAIILSGIVLVAYFWGTAAADRWDDRRSYVNKAIMLVRIATSSVVTAAFYQTQNNPNSLQGQTCGVNGVEPPKKSVFPSFNFDKFCLMQVGLTRCSFLTC